MDAQGSDLLVTASYEAELGVQGAQITQRQFRKEFRLPDHIEVDEVNYLLTKEGILLIEILLKETGEAYRCSVTTEEIT